MTGKEYIFYSELVKGSCIKGLIDVLGTAFKHRPCFKISKEGLSINETNDDKLVLFVLDFPRTNWNSFYCKKGIRFNVNVKHMSRLFKSVKKKDSLKMYIPVSSPDKLFFEISNSAEDDSEINDINIVYDDFNKEETQIPDTYEDEDGNVLNTYGLPKLIKSSAFLKTKKLVNTREYISVEMQRNNYIKFFVNNTNLYNCSVHAGKLVQHPEEESVDSSSDEDDEVEDDENLPPEEYKGFYSAQFHNSLFLILLKIPSLGTNLNLNFYSPRVDGYPLKVFVNIGGIGTLRVYLKDMKQINIETEKKRQSEIDAQYRVIDMEKTPKKSLKTKPPKKSLKSEKVKNPPKTAKSKKVK